MDGQRFEALTRSLAGGMSRRGVVRGLAAGIAAAAAGLSGLGGAEARQRCRLYNEICRKHGDCCDFNCGPKDNTGRRRCGFCPNGGEVCGDECCGEGQACIDGACCDNPCGGDGSDVICCGAGETCNFEFFDEGVVVSCCPEGSSCPATESCCAETETCTTTGCCESASACESPAGNVFCCPAGLGCTDNGCVGACEHSSCSDTVQCITGRTCCDGCCLDLEGDEENCGACGNICPQGTVCCSGSCVDPSNDPQNCGGCGNECGFYVGSQQCPFLCINSVCSTTQHACNQPG